MSTPRDGGPAFPSPDWNGSWVGPDANHGMSFRAYAAVAAMQGLLAGDAKYGGRMANREALAADAVAHADALVKALGGEE